MQIAEINQLSRRPGEASSPANRSLDLMAAELTCRGQVSPELWAMVLDEERTQASEVLAAQEQSYAAIPRTYFSSPHGLADVHGQSLNKVFDDGVAYSQDEARRGVPGANWELVRRQTERRNLDVITEMAEGTICVEVSATPSDKPAHEITAQHYNGLTMIRASIKGRADGGRVRQFNYAIPLDKPDFLLAIQRKLGIAQNRQSINSQQLLENPVLQATDLSPEAAARQIDGLIGAALLESAVGNSAVRMLSRAIKNRREAWEFINSAEQADLDNELLAAMSQAAALAPAERAAAIKAIRSGYYKELKDRFSGKKLASGKGAMAGSLLADAAARAVADGDVFVACGDTVKAASFSQSERAAMIKSLRDEIRGSGACQACGKNGILYGCGLCGGCNKKWCDEYEATGKQTAVRDLAYRSLARPTGNPGIIDTTLNELAKSWQKLKADQLAKAA